jgi:prepilin-type N-terminal cleavage/methylation domain-containing protein
MRRTGFTLTELLVVLGVAAVLAAILFPVLSLLRSRARQSACLSNLRQLHIAFAMYAADHDGDLPPYNNVSLVAQETPGGRVWHYPPRGDLLASSLLLYTHSRAVWFCPEDTFAGRNTLTLPFQKANVAGLLIDHRYGSYETSWCLGLVRRPLTMEGITLTDRYGPLEFRPSAQPLLCDEAVERMGCGDWAYSHQDGFNEVYLDGHVRTFRPACAR